jgi:hypothetical protein
MYASGYQYRPENHSQQMYGNGVPSQNIVSAAGSAILTNFCNTNLLCAAVFYPQGVSAPRT